MANIFNFNNYNDTKLSPLFQAFSPKKSNFLQISQILIPQVVFSPHFFTCFLDVECKNLMSFLFNGVNCGKVFIINHLVGCCVVI